VFRTVMYPRYGPAGGGLLRLHSTYRHDLKIYSSDEGRVQTSAAAFTQGLLDLEGDSLTPILVRRAWGPALSVWCSCGHAGLNPVSSHDIGMRSGNAMHKCEGQHFDAALTRSRCALGSIHRPH